MIALGKHLTQVPYPSPDPSFVIIVSFTLRQAFGFQGPLGDFTAPLSSSKELSAMLCQYKISPGFKIRIYYMKESTFNLLNLTQKINCKVYYYITFRHWNMVRRKWGTLHLAIRWETPESCTLPDHGTDCRLEA